MSGNRARLQAIIHAFETADSRHIDELIAANYLDHQGLAGTEVTGVEGFRRVVAAAGAAMPNLRVTIEGFVTGDDLVIAQLRWSGKTPQGRVLERQTLDVLRIRDGRLAEHWGAGVDGAAQHYRSNDWIDPRVEIRSSPVHGRGAFARTRIEADEIVTIWGGTFILTEDSLLREHASGIGGWSLATIGDGRYLGRIVPESEEDLTNLLNHSCDPNLWMHDEVTLGARRDIYPGEELTFDYAMIEDNEEWVGPFECRCGSQLCRGRFTGRDWRREDLRAGYAEHFSPFINARIRRLQAGLE